MHSFDDLKAIENLYSIMGLQQNPFSISPLFKDFKDINECAKDEKLLVLPPELRRDMKMLLLGKNQRALIHGLYGVGKTSIVDFILYLSHNFHQRFCVRTIVTEDNVNRAIHEMLLSLCFEILGEIATKSVLHPIEAIRKWVAEKRYADALWANLIKLMGNYSETIESQDGSKKKKKMNLNLGVISLDYGTQTEVETRKTIQSYVEVLPVRKVTEYLKDFHEIIQFLGFKDIIIFIDEADHLSEISSFLKMLTKAREVLFTKGYTFLIAGSVEIAKYTESMGTIFDKLIFIRPSDEMTFRHILEQRIKSQDSQLALSDIFEDRALDLIYNNSMGITKTFLRLCENAVDLAVYNQSNRVTEAHCQMVLRSGKDEITIELRNIHIKILKYLASKGQCFSSDKEFQQAMNIKRAYLRTNLEELVHLGYVHKEKRGRNVYYGISVQFRSYFATV